MGIDVYLTWNNKSEEAHQRQMTGFSITSGHVGYLREAYHGGPYATRILMPEGFEEPVIPEGATSEEIDELYSRGVKIPVATLRARLPETIAAVIARAKEVYKEDIDKSDLACQAFENFVELAEKLEAEGKDPRVIVSY